ncbi:MAG TPA: surface-adhesin E family protein [Gallionellaceae bacterium]|nr:surface-adhesin E family protein [Gallionellaceae bacterium]
MIRAAVFSLMMMCYLSTQAADWYFFPTVQSSHEVYFFDRDSVVKHGSTVTVWDKSVHDESYPADNGVHSLTARDRFQCRDRTLQSLSWVTYNKSGEVLFSMTTPQAASQIVPGTIGESMLSVVCSKKFPNVKGGALYNPVNGNDVDAAAETYFADEASKKIDAAPADPDWYFLPRYMTEHNTALFIDANSVKKGEDGVLVWSLLVFKEQSPDMSAVGQWDRYSCPNFTLRDTRATFYGGRGKFLFTTIDHRGEVPILPGSVSESIEEIVCSTDFPKPGHADAYVHIDKNDPYAFAQLMYARATDDKDHKWEQLPDAPRSKKYKQKK